MSYFDQLVTCPLTKNKNLKLIEKISVDELVKLYKMKRNIDIGNEFDHKYIYLFQNEDIDFFFFYPFKSGSKKFYEELNPDPQNFSRF